MRVDEFLSVSACRTPDAVALIEPGRQTITYGDLDRLANRFANALRSVGLRRADRVMLALPTGIEMAAAYLGTMKAGGVAVPLSHNSPPDRIAEVVADCTPAVCIVDRTVAASSAGRGWMLQGRVWAPATLHKALDAAVDRAPAAAHGDDDLAAIVYTSGSTGSPRGVMLTHRNIAANTRSIVSYLDLTARDRVMSVLPLYYVYGLSLLHTHLAVGGSVVIDRRFQYPNVVLDAMQQYEVTGFAGVPSTFSLLLHRTKLPQMTFPHLRYVTQAGGALSPARVLEWLERGPAAPLYVMYGATEASARLTYLPPGDLRRKLGSIGRAIPGVEIDVVTDGESLASAGEVGEIVARGENIAAGYWGAPEETRARFGPLGFRTGDLGYRDEEGFLFLVGRRHDMFKIGGHRVSAKEIEDALCEHPDVHDAAVIGVPHDILGESTIAFVTSRGRDAVDPELLLRFCRTRVPAHKVPGRVVVLNDLPRLEGIGKPDKQALKRSLDAWTAV